MVAIGRDTIPQCSVDYPVCTLGVAGSNLIRIWNLMAELYQRGQTDAGNDAIARVGPAL